MNQAGSSRVQPAEESHGHLRKAEYRVLRVLGKLVDVHGFGGFRDLKGCRSCLVLAFLMFWTRLSVRVASGRLFTDARWKNTFRRTMVLRGFGHSVLLAFKRQGLGFRAYGLGFKELLLFSRVGFRVEGLQMQHPAC